MAVSWRSFWGPWMCVARGILLLEGGGIFSVLAARVRVRLEPSLHAQRIAPTPIHGGARSTACPGSDLRRARMPSSRHGLRGHLHPTFSTHDSSHQVASRWTVSRITTGCVCVCDRPVLPCTLSSLFPQHPLGVEYSTSTRPVGFPVLVSRSFSHNSTHSRSVHRCAALSCIFFTGSDPSLPDLGCRDSHLGLGLASKSMPSSDPTSVVSVQPWITGLSPATSFKMSQAPTLWARSVNGPPGICPFDSAIVIS